MSRTLSQIFTDNPIATNASTDLMYFSQSPYTPGHDAGMTFSDFAAQFPVVNPSALTKTDDTNVTLTLGGTPATALLEAVSLTLGWSGTLSPARGGTGVNNGSSTLTMAGSHTLTGAFSSTFNFTNTTNVTFPTSGTLATTSQLPTPAALTKTDDTNVTLTLGGTPATALLQATSLTLGWTGQLGLTRGGTNASLVASNGGIVYSTASAMGILAGTATANQLLMSGSSTTPLWSTTTYPTTNAINTIMYASSANVLGVITPANSSVMISSAAGVPSWSTTLPSGLSATNMNLITPTLGAATATSITFNPTTGGIVGTTTNDNAATGFVGEYVTNTASGVSLTTATPKTITSISLGAGDWEVSGNLNYTPAAGTTVTLLAGSVSSTTNTHDTGSSFIALQASFATSGNQVINTGLARKSLSGPATVYLVATASFGVSTMTVTGIIAARRPR